MTFCNQYICGKYMEQQCDWKSKTALLVFLILIGIIFVAFPTKAFVLCPTHPLVFLLFLVFPHTLVEYGSECTKED